MDDEHADVTFIVGMGKERVPAHKAILVARCVEGCWTGFGVQTPDAVERGLIGEDRVYSSRYH